MCHCTGEYVVADMTTFFPVSFKQYYDLVFRSRNARLGANCYKVEFLDWVKAGIAFNTRGCELGTRKISMFASLYETLSLCVEEGPAPIERKRVAFSDALIYFYEDIYSMYQDHLQSEQMKARRKGAKQVPTFSEVLIVPSFQTVPWMSSVFEVRTEQLLTYTCKNERAFTNNIASPYLQTDTRLYHSMAMMFDYGVGRVGRDILLEVSLWEVTA